MIDNSKKYLLIKLIIIVILIWALSALAIIWMLKDWSSRGAFGDLFGAVNTLFSALAFATLIYTIILQRDEIKENKVEIALNRKELVKIKQKNQLILTQQEE